jgi:hypothetical protein
VVQSVDQQVDLLGLMDQALELQLMLHMSVQLSLFGMMLQINAFTAHYQISPFKRTLLQQNGNAIVTLHSSLLPTLMVLKLVNDKNLFDLLFWII